MENIKAYELVNKLLEVDIDNTVDLRLYDFSESPSFSIAVKSSDLVLFEVDDWGIRVRLNSISKDRKIYPKNVDSTFERYENVLKDFFSTYTYVNLNGEDVFPEDIVLSGFSKHSFMPEIVGAAEAAQLLGITKKSLYGRMARGNFPEPITKISASLIWLKSDILAFREKSKQKNRLS